MVALPLHADVLGLPATPLHVPPSLGVSEAMTTSEPSVNIVLMLAEHLPQAIRSTKANIAKLESALTEERANLEVLIRHAAVGNIPHEEEVVGSGSTDASA